MCSQIFTKSSHSTDNLERSKTCFVVECMTFGAIGISHWKSAVSVREQFYLSNAAKEELYLELSKISDGVLILDTCNRIEVYAECEAGELIQPLCEAVNSEVDFFNEHGYKFDGEEAMDHLYSVGLGLDSQILGDVQIIQQLKKAYGESTQREFSGRFHELIQSVLRAHKRTRTETDFASGAASVGYAATQATQRVFPDLSKVKVLLVGAGKMGKNVSKNLVSQGVAHLSVINRTYQKAERLAQKHDIEAFTFEELSKELNKADVIITATGSKNPILRKEDFKGLDQKKRLILDLSVPRNVDKAVVEIPEVELIDMDTIDEATREAIEQRKMIIPKVKSIIKEEQQKFIAKRKRDEYLAPRLEFIHAQIDSITEAELERVKNQVGDEAFEKMENVAHRIKKKILAFHIEHLEKHLEVDEA